MSVPFDVSDDVATIDPPVIVPPVREEITADAMVAKEEMRLVDVVVENVGVSVSV